MAEETRVQSNTTGTRRRNEKAERPRTRPVQGTTPEQRRRMIAENAYYRAAERGFKGGDPTRDWLEAEAEVEALLLSDKTPAATRPKTKQ